MEDLNDKVTGGELSASEWNQVPSEIQTVIEATGQTLSGADLAQLAKGIASYAAAGKFFTDSGAADAYVLTPIGTRKGPAAYSDGQQIEFVTTNPGSGGAATVNVASLGAKSIKTSDGSNPAAGAITGRVKATFDAGNDWFELEADISSVYASRDTVYTDSGAANTYVLTAAGEAPSSYFDGMTVRFSPANDNNGASTVNVGGLGVKTIANASTGFIKTGVQTELVYRSGSGDFIINNTGRYASGDEGFVITNGVIEQWGATGDLGDIGAGDQTSAHAFTVPFPSSVDSVAVTVYGLLLQVDAATVIACVNDVTTTLANVGLLYRETSLFTQANWEIRWRAIGS